MVSGSRASSLSLYLLGPFRAFVDGVEVDDSRWARRKAKLLVKLLAVQPRHQLHREEVMDLLWPDLDPAAAANNLHKTIHQARRALEPGLTARQTSEFVHVRAQCVVLRAPGELLIDVEVFEQHATRALASGEPDDCGAALARYAGDLLRDDPYEEWAMARREHARALSRALLERVTQALLEHGDYTQGVARAHELLAVDPLNESAHRLVMLLHALSGSRHKALLQYRRCVELLEAELGVGPEPETEALYDRIHHDRIQPVTPVTPVTRANAEPDFSAGSEFAAGTPAPLNNLPVEFTSFVGRAWMLSDVRRALAGARLVTLTGPGGIGKTRLALRVAVEELHAFPGGVWFVDLAPVTPGSSIWQAVVRAAGMREDSGREVDRGVLDWFRDRRALLVVDNCEHVVDEAARVIAALVAGCADVKVIATSREALGLAAETVRAVQPLSLPGREQEMFAATVMEFEASRLFFDRAVAADPGFTVTDRNAHVLAGVCRRLDGIPLAIELAAAYARMLGLEHILTHLDERFRLLAHGARSLPSRHQTLRATIDWSYNLLAEPERIAFRWLSVFAGGATLEAACAVFERMAAHDGGADAPDGLAALRALAEKSLVVVDRRFAETRYRFLDTIREYAGERLRLAGEGAQAAEEHRVWCLDLARRARAHFGTGGETIWMDRLEAEHDNFRAAIDGCLADESGGAEALEFCALLGNFWSVRGHGLEGRAWLASALDAGRSASAALRATAIEATLMCHHDYAEQQSLLEQSLALLKTVGDEPALARARRLLASVLVNMGDYGRATEMYLENLEVFRRLDDKQEIATALFGLGFSDMSAGDFASAGRWMNESLELSRELGNERRVSLLLHNMGEIAMRLGEYDRAVELLGEALEAAKRLGFKVLEARTRNLFGYTALERGDADEARGWFEEALVSGRETGDSEGIMYSLDGLASVAAMKGNAERALRLAGAAQAVRTAIKVTPSSIEAAAVDRRLAQARAAFGPGGAARVFQEGCSMDTGVAIDYALAG